MLCSSFPRDLLIPRVKESQHIPGDTFLHDRFAVNSVIFSHAVLVGNFPNRQLYYSGRWFGRWFAQTGLVVGDNPLLFHSFPTSYLKRHAPRLRVDLCHFSDCEVVLLQLLGVHESTFLESLCKVRRLLRWRWSKDLAWSHW